MTFGKVIKHKKTFFSKFNQKIRQVDYNHGQNMWNKVKNSTKIGQDYKKVIYNFACFLNAIVKV